MISDRLKIGIGRKEFYGTCKLRKIFGVPLPIGRGCLKQKDTFQDTERK